MHFFNIYKKMAALSSASVGMASGGGGACGRVEVILGPMMSGKSTELLRRVRRFTVASKYVAVITHADDVRHGGAGAGALATHDAQTWQAVVAETLADAEAHAAVRAAEIVAIDEGQFFADLAPVCNEWADGGKIVIVAALDSDYKREPWPSVAGLCAEHLTKLSAVCMRCFEPAAWSRRLTEETEVRVVGGKDKYEALCRRCYILAQDEP
jgi:thymidine kinase